jgi:hypothetical protein
MKRLSAAEGAIIEHMIGSFAKPALMLKGREKLWMTKVVSGENNASNVSIEIARSGGNTVSWGSGKKEVLKIFEGIEKELAKVPPAETK